ncbi:hypothetical protein A2U01_0016416 [Trifolium medium]|uniref:Uncharacterized protein n=1 Tax=Trifolium medium TaxID=97028 RepID=A0A392N6L2_9FABA|nr:hypothetical protein [Trifolium medium]
MLVQNPNFRLHLSLAAAEKQNNNIYARTRAWRRPGHAWRSHQAANMHAIAPGATTPAPSAGSEENIVFLASSIRFQGKTQQSLK